MPLREPEIASNEVTLPFVFSPYFEDTYGGKGCDLIKFPINQGHFFDFAKSS